MAAEIDPHTVKVVYARLGGITALSALVATRHCESALTAIEATTDPYHRSLLFSGLVVAYARAFEVARDSRRGMHRRFSTRGIDGFDKVMHDTLLHLRDRYVAHLGQETNDYDLIFVEARVEATRETPEGPVTEFVWLGLGSRAQASFCIGPESEDGGQRLRHHLTAIQRTASRRLSEQLMAHQVAWQERAELTGNHGDDPPKLLHSRTFTGDDLSAGFTIGPHDMMKAFPVKPDGLALAFGSLFFGVVVSDQGQVVLQEHVSMTSDKEPWGSRRPTYP